MTKRESEENEASGFEPELPGRSCWPAHPTAEAAVPWGRCRPHTSDPGANAAPQSRATEIRLRALLPGTSAPHTLGPAGRSQPAAGSRVSVLG